jgi:integrase
MQNGSITRSTRLHGPDVWEFRWREAGADGKRKHRRMVIGSIAQFSDTSSPVVLSVSEVQQLLDALAIRERTLVLLDVGTGLRMSELFGLKWKDVDFDANEISVVRSIVMQVTGPCKTEASQKPIPLDPHLAETLRAWRQHVRYNRPEDWVFANPRMKDQQPYWGQAIMRKVIRPIAIRVGISKRIGWHTFRHTYSTLLRVTRVDVKVMQELLRHASSRVTMDTYTQAVTAQKREAQSGVVRLFRGSAMPPATEV